MAGKLTIRRVGNFLPTLCLVGVVLAVAVIIWLCTAGLPGSLLRQIEKNAAEYAGISLNIDKIRLSPSSGLAFKAEDVRVALNQPDAAPATLRIRKVQVAISIARMLAGQLKPVNILVAGGNLNIPLSNAPEDAVSLNGIEIYTRFPRRGEGISTELTAGLSNIHLKAKISLSNPAAALKAFSADEGADSQEKSIGEQLAEIRPALLDLKRQLDHQKWTEKIHPVVSITLNHRKAWRAELEADIPSYEVRHFHFRDAKLKANIENSTISIDNLRFRTISPDTYVTLRGGYDWKLGELEFHARSTAPLLDMLHSYMGEDAPAVLSRLQAAEKHTPTIELEGSASLSEDYALNRFALRGKIEQQNAKLGNTPIDSAQLSFYLQNGSFQIDHFKLVLPDGQISASAHAVGETGHAELDFSLPGETILTLAKDLSGDDSLQLPPDLTLPGQLKVRARANMSLPPFQAGKSHIEDLIPELNSCHLQFNSEKIIYKGSDIVTPALTLEIDGIKYDDSCISAQSITLNAKVGDATATIQQLNAKDVLLHLQLENAAFSSANKIITLDSANVHFSAVEARWMQYNAVSMQTNAQLSALQFNTDDIAGTVKSEAVSAKLNAQTLACDDISAKDIYTELLIPEGIFPADKWENMQRDTELTASIREIQKGVDFVAHNNKLNIHNTAKNQIRFELSSNIAEEQLNLSTTASLQQDSTVMLDDIRLNLPAASLAPLAGGEPLKELKLPKLVTLQGKASINHETGRVNNCDYQLQIPELVRVCNNVYVHRNMEIPLSLSVDGSFETKTDGEMRYDADVEARHELGELKVHVSGNPASECRITGSNTIPVNIINALIDNADAHWIMRDFRCTPGVTRNIISDIDTTIRYDKGIYVQTRCKAQLYNMDFLLGAIRDKEDAKGNPTGEEYLRTDLSKDPYSRIKEGKCDVEVLVQMNCEDAEGNALPERIRINLINPDMIYDNRPWLKRQGFKTGATTSRITGEAVRFNIEDCTISLHKLKGTCYPAYSIGMYYAPIQHFLEDIELKSPADIETDFCIFPLSSSCDIPMQGLIKAKAANNAGFRFLGTTIPFTHFSGFINISDTDVYLDRMNAQCWGGVLNGSLRIGFSGEHTTLDGYFVADNLNLKDIVASYGETFTPAACSGFIRFQADKPELEAVRAYGQVHLKDGELMQMGLFRPIGAFLSDLPGNLTKLQETVYLKEEEAPPSWVDNFISAIFNTGSDAINSVQNSAYNIPFANHFLRYGIDEAFSRFDIMNGHLLTRDMRATGYNLDVGVQLDIDLNSLTLTGDLWPRISSVPTIIISPITILSDFLIDIDLHGDLLAPQWKFGLSKKRKNDEPSLSPEPQDKKPGNKN